jgi:hypothetical protein
MEGKGRGGAGAGAGGLQVVEAVVRALTSPIQFIN